MVRLAQALTLALLGLCLPRGARAVNLLPNGSFDVDVAGWQTFNSVPDGRVDLYYEPGEDRVNPALSGAGRVENTSVAPFSTIGSFPIPSVCFPVVADAGYELGGSVRFPASQATTGEARLMVFAYGDPDCQMASVGGASTSSVPESTVDWTDLSAPFMTPADAQAARVWLILTKNEAGGTLVAYFDDVFLAPEPGGNLGIAAAFATLAALHARRSRRRP
jgi:hypothetical protein